jgi:predicted glycoside hydrolase/deacetylase ChbG (UPF0249 family)
VHQLIVTADDFGLSDETNRGIVDAHLHGIVTSTSILMNAPKTKEAVALAKTLPSLEVGIHLGFVEGYSLVNKASTITDPISYFPGHQCLHRHWRPFIKSYLLKKLNLQELKQELEAQCEAFMKAFPEKSFIPFANGTQHLHLLPQIAPMVVELCRRYKIRFLRAPSGQGLFRRLPYGPVMGFLGARLRRQKPVFLGFSDEFLGFDASGKVDKEYLKHTLQQIRKTPSTSPKTFELMTHPGYDASHLRLGLPWAYRDFDWDGERMALTDPEILSLLKDYKINLMQFRNLTHVHG